MSFVNNDFGGSSTSTSSPNISPPITMSPPQRVPTLQEVLNNLGANSVNCVTNPFVAPTPFPPLPLPTPFAFNPFLPLSNFLNNEMLLQQIISLSKPLTNFPVPPIVAEPSSLKSKRHLEMTKSVSVESSDETMMSYDNNGDIIVPSNDKEGWCRNKKYIEKIENGFMCTVCRKVYGRYNSVSYHVTIYHRNPPIRCNLQNCQFTTREARYIHFHKYYRHGIPLPQSIDQGSRKCPHCRHVSKSPAMLDKHIRRHQLKEDAETASLAEAMRLRTATISEVAMEVEAEEEEEFELGEEEDGAIGTKPRSCTM